MKLKEKIEELTKQRALFIGLSLMEQDKNKKDDYWKRNEELEKQIIELQK